MAYDTSSSGFPSILEKILPNGFQQFLPQELDEKKDESEFDRQLSRRSLFDWILGRDDQVDREYTVTRIFRDDGGQVQITVRNPWGGEFDQPYSNPEAQVTVSLATLVKLGSLKRFRLAAGHGGVYADFT